MKKGFTLLEIVIVAALIASLGMAAIALLNPKDQIGKSWDGKRKEELATVKKAMEDFYNDKLCYPKPTEICYDGNKDSTTCNICGNEADSPTFDPYLPQLPCDPEHPSKNLLYEVDDVTCPTWYRIYSKFSTEADPVITDVGCQYGCGPGYSYQYGISSPNIDLVRNLDGAEPTPTGGPGPTSAPTPTGQQFQCGVSCGCGPCGNGYQECSGQSWTDSSCRNQCTPCGGPQR